MHGGQSGETLRTMSDWNLFDIGMGIWIELTVEQVKSDGSRCPFELYRKMHSITPVVDKQVPHFKDQTRIMWASQVKELVKSGATVSE